MEYILIFISAIFVNNIVLSQFLGICPFLGVSQKISTSLGMGAAVAFVLTLSTIVTYLVQIYILNPMGLQYLQTIAFILVIAALVQMVEIILKKVSPSLYQALGISERRLRVLDGCRFCRGFDGFRRNTRAAGYGEHPEGYARHGDSACNGRSSQPCIHGLFRRRRRLEEIVRAGLISGCCKLIDLYLKWRAVKAVSHFFLHQFAYCNGAYILQLSPLIRH